MSAQQARERKKAYLTDLEVKVKNLEKKNSEIEEKLSTLQNENQMLRQVHFALSMYLARKICLFDDLNSVDFVWDPCFQDGWTGLDAWGPSRTSRTINRRPGRLIDPGRVPWSSWSSPIWGTYIYHIYNIYIYIL